MLLSELYHDSLTFRWTATGSSMITFFSRVNANMVRLEISPSRTVGHFSCHYPIPTMAYHKIFPAAQLRTHFQACYPRLHHSIALCLWMVPIGAVHVVTFILWPGTFP